MIRTRILLLLPTRWPSLKKYLPHISVVLPSTPVLSDGVIAQPIEIRIDSWNLLQTGRFGSNAHDATIDEQESVYERN